MKKDATQRIKITSFNLVRDFINASRKGDEFGKGTININHFWLSPFHAWVKKDPLNKTFVPDCSCSFLGVW
jgi:hypothetical protein